MKAGMRRESTEVEIHIRLPALLEEGQVCYLSPAGVLLFADRIEVKHIERVSVCATGTHLYRRPSEELQGVPGRRCGCCDQLWLYGTRFCLDAECTTALEQGAVRGEIDALPAGERDERLYRRYGLQSGDMIRPGDKRAKRPKLVLMSAPAVLAQAGAKGSRSFQRAFASAASSSSMTRA